MKNNLLLVCILVCSLTGYVRYWEVDSNLGYISRALFTTYDNKLYLWLVPYGVFLFDKDTWSWQSLGQNAASAQHCFTYRDSSYETGLFFKRKVDKPYYHDKTGDLNKYKYQIKRKDDSLVILEIGVDTTYYSALAVKDTPFFSESDALLHFYDGTHFWFSLLAIVGDGIVSAGFGYFDTSLKTFKIFTLEELDVEYYSIPRIFTMVDKDLWIGTGNFSDYGPEPYGAGIYIFDLNEKKIRKHVMINRLETSPTVLDMSFNSSEVWIATTLGIFRWYLKDDTWQTWKIDTCATITDSISMVVMEDRNIHDFIKIPKGKIVRLIGQAGGGHESQTGTGSYVIAEPAIDGWIFDKTIRYRGLHVGDTSGVMGFTKVYTLPDTTSVLITDGNDPYGRLGLRAVLLDKEGDWYKFRFHRVWIPFSHLKYDLMLYSENK